MLPLYVSTSSLPRSSKLTFKQAVVDAAITATKAAKKAKAAKAKKVSISVPHLSFSQSVAA
jgi:hypothetical protein